MNILDSAPRLVGPAFKTRFEKFWGLESVGIAANGLIKSSEYVHGILEETFTFSTRCSLRTYDDFDNGPDNYYLPLMCNVEQVFENRSSRGMSWREGVFDCKAYAYSLKADFIMNRCRTPAVITPFAVGIIWGSDGNGGDKHVANFAVIADGADGVEVKIVDASPNETDYSNAESWGRNVDYLVI